jgi:hypothetical protein
MTESITSEILSELETDLTTPPRNFGSCFSLPGGKEMSNVARIEAMNMKIEFCPSTLPGHTLNT